MAVIRLDIFLTALSAMAKIFLICCSGALAARLPKSAPLLPPALLSQLARVMNFVFLPCLMLSSMGSVISVEILSDFFPLLYGSVAMIISSYIFSRLLRACLRLPRDEITDKLVVATSFPNCVSLPLLLVETLCEQRVVFEEFGNEAKCFEVASSMTFVYSIGWHLCFWSFAYNKLGKSTADAESESTNNQAADNLVASSSTAQMLPSGPNNGDLSLDGGGGGGGGGDGSDPKGWLDELERSGTSAASDVPLGGGASPPPPAAAGVEVGRGGKGAEAGGGRALARGYSSSAAGLRRLVSAHLMPQLPPPVGPGEGEPGGRARALRRLARQLFLQPTMLSIFLGFGVGLTPLQGLMFKNENSPLRPLGSAISAIGTPLVTLSIIVMAGSLAQMDLTKGFQGRSRNRTDFGEAKNSYLAPDIGKSTSHEINKKVESSSVRITWKHTVFFLLCRLVAFPAAGCLVILGPLRGALPAVARSRLLQLVFCVQTAVPSAQIIIVCLSQFKQQKIASAVSLLYVYQYLSSILTLTVIISMAMSVIYT